MANEIERKFLVDDESELFKSLMSSSKGTDIAQGYLNTDPEKTVRVRQKGTKGYLTVKGKQVGISKPEYEYEIPVEDVRQMMLMCDVKLEKVRFEVKEESGLTWEIDVFKGLNDGLIIVEIELPDESKKFKIPSWLGKEVSEDLRFANSNLAKVPYGKWSDEAKEEIRVWKKLNPEVEAKSLISQMVGGCTCMTKTPDIQYHKDGCQYKEASKKLTKLKI